MTFSLFPVGIKSDQKAQHVLILEQNSTDDQNPTYTFA